MSHFDLNNRIVCVTGASSGIGRCLAKSLALSGASVVVIARRKTELEELVRTLASCGANSAFVEADLTDSDNLDMVVEKTASHFGDPDILINAAGMNPRIHADELSLEKWDLTLNLNLTIPFFLAQKFVPAMIKKGWGRIINIASLQSERAFANGIAYGASKGGIAQLTRAMAEAWSSKGVNCNAIAPGFFPTELTNAVFSNEKLSSQFASQTCIGRNGKLDDLVGPAIFLSSKASDYVTGQVLFVDGGFTAK